MALRIIDGFDYHTAEGNITALPSTGNFAYHSSYSTANLKFTATNKRLGTGLCLTPTAVSASTNCASSCGLYYKMPFAALGTTLVIGIAVYLPALVAAPIFSILGTSGGQPYMLGVICTNASGQITPYYFNDTSTMYLMGTCSTALTAAKWQYLECEWNFTASKTTCNVYLGGVSIGTFTANTGGVTPAPDRIILGYAPPKNNSSPSSGVGGAANNTIYYDDFYVLDAANGAPTTRLGDVHVEALYPSAEVVNVNFARSGGTGPADTLGQGSEDTTTYYNGSNVADELIVNTTSTLLNGAGTIYGVGVTQLSQRMDTTTTRAMTGVVREGTGNTETAGTGVTLDTTFDYVETVFPVAPSTSSAWTVSQVQGMGFGVRITA